MYISSFINYLGTLIVANVLISIELKRRGRIKIMCWILIVVGTILYIKFILTTSHGMPCSFLTVSATCCYSRSLTHDNFQFLSSTNPSIT